MYDGKIVIVVVFFCLILSCRILSRRWQTPFFWQPFSEYLFRLSFFNVMAVL